jgi:hypothetical protein
MCVDSDLFGEIIVTVDEVNLWLDCNANLTWQSHSRRNYYAEYYDVANKIKLSKLDGSFYLIISNHLENIEYNQKPLEMFAPVYKALSDNEKKPACPSWYHDCDVPTCPCFIKRKQRAKNALIYAKRKRLKH